MAFNTNPGKQQFSASAGQTVFAFNFAIFADTDLKVYLTPSGNTADDTADILTLATDYSVSINGTLGGTVTLSVGASLNDTVTIVRALPVTRTTDYAANGDLYADTLDADQDYQTYLVLDGYTQLQRALIVPESLSNVDLDLPAPVSDSYIKWNATADALENDTSIPNNLVLSQTAATTATTQAGIATTKAGGASTSATNAQLSAWEAEAEKMTADSYATEAEDVLVKIYTSDGDGTFTATPTTEYSALHWAAKSALAAQGDAVNISYNNVTSGLTATNVQTAIDELSLEKANNSDVVKLAGDQTVAGVKTFTSSPILPTPTEGDNSTKGATTAFVKAQYAIGTAVSANGVSENFISIPSWVKRITMLFSGVSTNGTSVICIKIGGSGGLETTGYSGGACNQSPTFTANTVGFNVVATNSAASVWNGRITLENISGNEWVFNSHINQAAANLNIGTGTKTLSSTLDRISATMVNGTDAFDAGIINITWE